MKLLNKIKSFAQSHKFWSVIIVLAVVVVAYYGYKIISPNKSGTSYVTAAVTKGTITTSVSGSGQVAASNAVSLQFQASGTIAYLPIQNGQNVVARQLLGQLDTTNAEKTVRDAEANLQSAQISLQRLEGAGNLSAPQNQQDAQNTLNQDFQNGYNAVSNAFLDLPSIMTDLQNTIYTYGFNNFQQNIDFYTYSVYTYDQNATQFKDSLVKSYKIASDEYTTTFNDYKSTTRKSDNATISSIISETYNTTRDIAQAIKDTNNLIQFYKDTLAKYTLKENSLADTQLSIIAADSSKANSDITSLLNTQITISKDTEAVANASLDIKSQELSIQNSQNSLQDAKDNLANYYIYAPFLGTVGKVTAHVGDSVGSGTSIATLITAQKICTIPLNEVDVAKVQAGQKVVLTFDALPDLTVAGQVATIDPVGTVTQGVVTYNVQINFDTQDARVKSGMSISAEIITNVKQDVILVLNSAVKTQGGTKYVQVLSGNSPQQKIVTTGLSNDTSTEIVSGLSAGDKVVTQTITTGSATANSSDNSGLRIPGITGGGGGTFIRTGATGAGR